MVDKNTMTTEQQALRDALDEVQNPFGRPTNAQEKLVLAAAEKWADALSAPPADDVREALPFVVSPKGGEWRHCSPELLYSGLNCGATLRRSCLCPGGGSHDHYVEVRPRGTVTDAEVERAARAYAGDEMSAEEWDWVKTQPHLIEPYLTGMRAALEAAREVNNA